MTDEPKEQKNQQVDEMATLIRRLVRSMKKANCDSKLQNQALDYLKRNGFEGSVLREK